MKLLLVGANETDQATLKNIFSRGNHQLSILDNAAESIKLLANEKYDLVLAGEGITDTNIDTFMEDVIVHSPLTVRVAALNLATDSDAEIANVHHQLSSPLIAGDLVKVLESSIASQKVITKQTIIKAVGQVKTLPSPPKVFMRLNALLKQDTTDSSKIAEIITQDPALVAKVLQFVNSSAMSKGKKIHNIPDAITKMGIDTLCCIVMTAEMFAHQPSVAEFSLEQEQLHSLATAKMAASLVKPELKQSTLIAGLLHGIGKLVLYEMNIELTKKFFKNRFNSSDNILLEQKIFSTDHSQIGGYLLHMWSFPYEIIEAIILQYQPEKLIQKRFGIAHAIYIANTLLNERELSAKFVEQFKLESLLDKLQARAERLKV